jgi:hypothetical protein
MSVKKTAKKHKHKWASIAPELAPEGEEPEAIWKWCIGCGWLKLGTALFAPGPHQKKVLIPEAS